MILLFAAGPVFGQAGDGGAPLDRGKALFAQGRYAEAAELLDQAFRSNPADPEVNFYVGRSAFERGDFETAVMAFERVLIMQPDASRVKLEMARSYMQLGSYGTARQYFEEVLESDPPEQVRRNVKNFLAALEARAARHFFSGSLSLGTGWDDNVRAAPDNESIRTALGDVLLTGAAASPRGDRVDTAVLSLEHTYRPPDRPLSWQTTALSFNAFYDEEDDLTLNFLTLTTGPALQSERFLVKLYGLFNYLDLDYRRYLQSFGGGATWTGVLHPRLLATADLKAEQKTFYRLEGKDATNVRLTVGPLFQVGANRIGLSGLLEAENAEADENSYDRLGVVLSFDRKLPFQSSVFASLRYLDTEYDAPSFPFDEARSDQRIELRLDLAKTLWQAPDSGHSLQGRLGGSMTESDSNIDLFEYDKKTATFSLVYLF